MKAPSEILHTDFDKIFIGSVCGEGIVEQLVREFKIPREKIENPFIATYYKPLELFLEYFARICKEKNLKGSIAELGVFQGDTAKRLNAIFKDKKLYLFDTFEGYHQNDISNDKSDTKAFGVGHLDNTSVEFVLQRMPYPQNVIIKKGWFPQSAAGLENERFCLVRLDPDLYEPVLAGLEFFYPRLEKGGIILSAYFSPHAGPKKALSEFIAKYGLNIIPLGLLNVAAIIKE